MKDLLNDLILSDNEILKEYNMKNLIRYNARIRIKDEDIAQHSYFVSLFCLKIFKKVNLTTEQKYNILVKAILHDCCEILTSDIPYDVKRNYPEVKDLFKNIELDYYKNNWKEYEKLFTNKDEDDIIDLIVKLADIYSVRQYALNESILGNKDDEMLTILKDTKERLENQIKKIKEKIKNE